MPRAREVLSRYRLVGLAVVVSAALHAAVFVGMPPRIAALDDGPGEFYSASLEPGGLVASPDPAGTAPARGAPQRRRASESKLPRSRIAPPPPIVPAPPEPAPEPAAVARDTPAPVPPAKVETPAPEQLALAQPATPIPALEAPKFPVEALPAEVSIEYRLTSAFADGRAAYRWKRDGDSYRITGEAEAEGFFTLFLEGRIVQETRGTLTASGLRPERFSESRPNATAPEGLEFDWNGRQVTFERGGERKTTALADNTVDWLSMIFQLAHTPPNAERIDLQVFTQRRLYRFNLQVVGIEEIEIPLGRVRALRLRHEDGEKKETVDVWLGVDQHYLPVKLRFPAARNRIVVEQVATRLSVSEASR